MRITESKLRRIIRGVIRESNLREGTETESRYGYASDGSELATMHGDYDMMGREVRPELPSSKNECCFEFIEKVISRLEEKHWLVDFSGSREDDCNVLLRTTPITLEQSFGRGSRPISVDINYPIEYWFNDYWLSLTDDSMRNHNKSRHTNHVSNCVKNCIAEWHTENKKLN